MNPEYIARVCHEVNRAYCMANGDLSLVPWDETPQAIRNTTIMGVEFKLANPDATPQQMHANWMKDKRAAGWTYGEVKDAEAMTHPAMVEYEHLPKEQRIKDYLFNAVVQTLS